jgi:hypothetical protein
VSNLLNELEEMEVAAIKSVTMEYYHENQIKADPEMDGQNLV